MEKSIAINPKAPDIVVVTRCPGLSFCIYKLHGGNLTLDVTDSC